MGSSKWGTFRISRYLPFQMSWRLRGLRFGWVFIIRILGQILPTESSIEMANLPFDALVDSVYDYTENVVSRDPPRLHSIWAMRSIVAYYTLTVISRTIVKVFCIIRTVKCSCSCNLQWLWDYHSLRWNQGCWVVLWYSRFGRLWYHRTVVLSYLAWKT